MWFLTGAWHGASWNFMLWGLFFGIILIIEKVVLLKVLEKLPKWTNHLYAMFLVLISWVIFAFEDLSKVKDYLLSMFHLNGNSIINAEGLYYLQNYAIIIIIGIILSTPLIAKIFKKLEEKQTNTRSIIISLIYIGILVLSTASLVSDSFNPFLYFRF